MDKMEKKTNSAMPVLIDLVAMYVITGLLLVILAALLGRLELSRKKRKNISGDCAWERFILQCCCWGIWRSTGDWTGRSCIC